jgi:hypothetical protein
MPNTENKTNQTASIINCVLLIIFGIISLFLILQRVDRYLKIKAIDECYKISKYERNIPEENAKVTYPLSDQYKSCIKNKGY